MTESHENCDCSHQAHPESHRPTTPFLPLYSVVMEDLLRFENSTSPGAESAAAIPTESQMLTPDRGRISMFDCRDVLVGDVRFPRVFRRKGFRGVPGFAVGDCDDVAVVDGHVQSVLVGDRNRHHVPVGMCRNDAVALVMDGDFYWRPFWDFKREDVHVNARHEFLLSTLLESVGSACADVGQMRRSQRVTTYWSLIPPSLLGTGDTEIETISSFG